jgi:hypothetical protein
LEALAYEVRRWLKGFVFCAFFNHLFNLFNAPCLASWFPQGKIIPCFSEVMAVLLLVEHIEPGSAKFHL